MKSWHYRNFPVFHRCFKLLPRFGGLHGFDCYWRLKGFPTPNSYSQSPAPPVITKPIKNDILWLISWLIKDQYYRCTQLVQRWWQSRFGKCRRKWSVRQIPEDIVYGNVISLKTANTDSHMWVLRYYIQVYYSIY